MAELSYIHRFVPGGDPPILALHGTGGDEFSMSQVLRLVAPESAALYPRGKETERGETRYFKRFDDGTIDGEDAQRRGIELAEFAREAAAEYGFDPEKLVAIGYSNGANAAVAMALAGTGLPKRMALLRPMIPFKPDPLPDLAAFTALILAGVQDATTPMARAEELAYLLIDCGADVQMLTVGSGHGLITADFHATRNWILG